MEMLIINGGERQFPEGTPSLLAGLLRQLGINEATVVVELDGSIIAREDFGKTQLSPGQNVELIRFVGGG